ncbi:hypothetical protein [Chryseobacterium culicis]|uniref:hypothetical protein n=1 Tax=Chryseobacterium culicis TaxID=680127 RepID=UPI0018736D2C|nr:hypothetical protein [Chryseobacterium culicis]MBE4949934.1 hypothetical protein [Chryseobacterium culicis]
MKTKHIKVSVSDRTPETAGYYFIINRAASIQIGHFNGRSFAESFIDPDYWLEEVPDYEEEMKEMLAKCMLEFGRFKAEFGQGSKLELEIKSLLTKLKTEP